MNLLRNVTDSAVRPVARYAFQDGVLAADDPNLQGALARAHAAAERPRCLCVDGGVEMYIAHYEHYIIKRLPGTGTAHDILCESYDVADNCSGLGALVGGAIIEHGADILELRVDFPLRLQPGRGGAASDAVERAQINAQPQRMSLRAVAHLLFERAGFNRWPPDVPGRRTQSNVRHALDEAAVPLRIRGKSLGERLLVPASFDRLRQSELNAIYRRQLASLHGTDDARPTALVVGEFKCIDTSGAVHKLWIKHMPNLPLLLDAATWRTLRRRFALHFDAIDCDTERRMRLLVCAIVFARRELQFQIHTATCLLATRDWIPLEVAYEAELIEALVAAKRVFVKPLRYDAPAHGGFANVLLLDVEDGPVPLHVCSGFMDKRERLAKERALSIAPRAWVWQTDQALPPLPPLRRR